MKRCNKNLMTLLLGFAGALWMMDTAIQKIDYNALSKKQPEILNQVDYELSKSELSNIINLYQKHSIKDLEIRYLENKKTDNMGLSRLGQDYLPAIVQRAYWDKQPRNTANISLTGGDDDKTKEKQTTCSFMPPLKKNKRSIYKQIV